MRRTGSSALVGPGFWRHPLTALAVVALWGSATLVSLMAMEGIGPMAVAFWRWLLALPVLWALLVVNGEGRAAWRALRRQPWPFVFLGLTGITLLYACQNLALRFTTAFNTGLLIELTPIFIIGLAVIWLRERPQRSTVAGIAIGLGGAVLLSFGQAGGEQPLAAGGSRAMLGNALAAGAALCGAIYTVYGKRLLDETTPLTTLTLSATLGTLFTLPLAMLEGGWMPPSPSTWAYLLVLGLGAGAFGNIWWFRMLQETEASRSGIYLFATALLASVLAVIVLGEPLTVWLAAGAALVFAGVRLVHRQDAPEESKPPTAEADAEPA